MSAEIMAALRRIEGKLDAVLKQRAASSTGGAVASDDDLDGQHGDPVVRFTPRDWTDGDFKGHKFSECPAAFLDLMAKALEYFASQKEGTDPKKAGWDRRDAARARGWAARARAGKTRPAARQAPATGGNYDFDDSGEAEADVFHSGNDDIPF